MGGFENIPTGGNKREEGVEGDSVESQQETSSVEDVSESIGQEGSLEGQLTKGENASEDINSGKVFEHYTNNTLQGVNGVLQLADMLPGKVKDMVEKVLHPVDLVEGSVAEGLESAGKGEQVVELNRLLSEHNEMIANLSEMSTEDVIAKLKKTKAALESFQS